MRGQPLRPPPLSPYIADIFKLMKRGTGAIQRSNPWISFFNPAPPFNLALLSYVMWYAFRIHPGVVLPERHMMPRNRMRTKQRVPILTFLILYYLAFPEISCAAGLLRMPMLDCLYLLIPIAMVLVFTRAIQRALSLGIRELQKALPLRLGELQVIQTPAWFAILVTLTSLVHELQTPCV